MSDQDLDTLLQEMEFSTPLRNSNEEGQKAPPGKWVLIPDPSITKMNPMRAFGETNISMGVPLTNIGASIEDLVSYTSGTSDQNSDDSKKYKLFIVDEPKEVCGTVMGQGITFCSDFDCQVNHRGAKEVLTLLEDHLYVAQSKTRDF